MSEVNNNNIPMFDGTEQGWIGYNFKFSAYCAAKGYANELVGINDDDAESDDKNKRLYGIIAM